MTAPDLTALADKLDELERSLDTIEDETCEGEDWMDYAGWEERYKARVSEAQDAFIHAARVALPQITTALREAARLRGVASNADRAMRFVKLVASQRLSEQAIAWYGGEFGEDGEPDFEGAYDSFIEQARSIWSDIERAALESPRG
jgi:hypothetical protein